jgi:arabinofuranosyltransferase
MDLVLMVTIILLTIIYTIIFFDPLVHPIEDAAMVMRYAQHVADGYGIVWNIGEKPVDGATDFLYMLLLAFFIKAGLSAKVSVIGLGYLSHILTVIIVYITARKIYSANIWVATIAATYLALGPGLGYVAAYFGTPVFGLSVGITLYFAIMLKIKSEASHLSIAFTVFGLITGLIRPEGVFLVLFMLIGIIYANDYESSKKTIIYFMGIFVVIGGAYFIWRWNYFGYPLPNPFYKKGGGVFYFSSLSQSVRNTIIMSLPLLPLYFLCIFLGSAKKEVWFFLFPVVGFTTIFAFISDEMNYLMRFQYATLVIVSLSWPRLFKELCINLKSIRPLKRLKQTTWIFLAIIASIGLVMYNPILMGLKKGNRRFREGTYDAALILREHKDKGYTIATTEAGLLPYYSGWRAIDTWGLNDQWVAHNGQITREYLKKNNPSVIMFHAYFSPMLPLKKANSAWDYMTLTLKDYAETNNYYLAAVFGVEPDNTHYYYIRQDFVDSLNIIRKIKQMDYSWYGTIEKATNIKTTYNN